MFDCKEKVSFATNEVVTDVCVWRDEHVCTGERQTDDKKREISIDVTRTILV